MAGDRNTQHPWPQAGDQAPLAAADTSSAQIRCERWEAFVQLYRNSLSNKRLLLRMPKEPPLGTPLRISLALPSGQELELEGRVVKTAPPTQGETLARVGVALDIGMAQRIAIDDFLEQARAAMEDERLEPEPQAPILERRRSTPASTGPRARASELPPPQRPARTSQMPIPVPSRTPPPRPSQLAPPRPSRTPPPRPSQLAPPRPSQLPPARPSQLPPSSPGAAPARTSRNGGPVVGIDFGTSSSSVAYLQQQIVTLIPEESGRSSIPSLVWFRDKGDYVVGCGAREKLSVDPTRTIPSVKRLLGLRFDDEAAGAFLGNLSCPSHAGANRTITFDLNGEPFTPVTIAALVLKRLKALAETHLATRVTRAVIAHPMSFGERQRQDLTRAAQTAGFELVDLIPEPVAVALAYNVERRRSGAVGVFDFGAGCFDFCILSMDATTVNVIAAGGDPWFGGDDLDVALAQRVAESFHRRTGIDLRTRPAEWQRVRHACEEAKVYLSLVDAYDVLVPGVAHEGGKSLDLAVTLSRGELDEIARRTAGRTIELCGRTLHASGLSPRSIGELLLTGGTTKVPIVRAAAQEFFGREPSGGVHPEQAVVSGAAIRAAELEGRRPSWNPLQPSAGSAFAGRTVGLALSVGETSPIIERSMPLPATVRRIFSTSRDGQTSLSLKIVEGEHHLSAHNRQVGGVNVNGLRPLPAGEGHVEVTFELNVEGTLNVTARDLTTGRTFASSFELGKLA